MSNHKSRHHGRRWLTSGAIAAILVAGLPLGAMAGESADPGAHDPGQSIVDEPGNGEVEIELPNVEDPVSDDEDVDDPASDPTKDAADDDAKETPSAEPTPSAPAKKDTDAVRDSNEGKAAPQSRTADEVSDSQESQKSSVSTLAVDLPPAPVVTVRGATAFEVSFGDYIDEFGPSAMGDSLVMEVFLASDTEEPIWTQSWMYVMSPPAPVQIVRSTTARPLEAGESYVVRVHAMINDPETWVQEPAESSDFSEIFTMQSESEKPGTLEEVPLISATGPTSAYVSWASITTGAEVYTYTVELFIEGTSSPVASKTGINPFIEGTSWSFTGLRANTSYQARVKAVGYDLEGDFSEFSEPVLTDPGAPLAPLNVDLTRLDGTDTGIRIDWEAPENDGGFPITSYRIELFTPGSSSAAGASMNNLFMDVQVPASQTHLEIPETAIVSAYNAGTTVRGMSARVFAVNQYGEGPASRHSGFDGGSQAYARRADLSTATIAASATHVNAPRYGDVVADGFTVYWRDRGTATSGSNTNYKPGVTGYLIRVVAQNPTSQGNPSMTTTIIDVLPEDVAVVGESNPSQYGSHVDGAFAYDVRGLTSNTRYGVTITPYEVVDAGGDTEHRLYRVSSALGSSSYAIEDGEAVVKTGTYITTTGSSVPKAPSKPPLPEVTGHDSLRWTGDPISESLNGGSPVTGYQVRVVDSLNQEVQTLDVTLSDAGQVVAEFTGLERNSWYKVQYAAVNEHGVGGFSVLSDGVRTDENRRPGTVPPDYLTIAQLRAAISRGDVQLVPAAQLGVAAEIEVQSTQEASVTLPGAETAELWSYVPGADTTFRAALALNGSRFAGEFTVPNTPAEGYLVAYGDNGIAKAALVKFTEPSDGITELDDAVFRWGFNNESNNGAFYGGCNFFVAGKIPDPGGSKIMPQGSYSAEKGNVRIEKPNSSGQYQLANWNNKCRDRWGSTVTSGASSGFTESQVVISGGTGWVEPSTGSAEIEWQGDFTVVYYGGLTFWYASNPKLVLEDGKGKLTATLSGYGTDMDDMSKWVELTPQTITLANFTDSKAVMTSQGLTALPDYLGVTIDSSGGRNNQPPYTPRDAHMWGSFPQDFVDFQVDTGQSSYWYYSGGAQDRFKVALPVYVSYDASHVPGIVEPNPVNPGGPDGEPGGPTDIDVLLPPPVNQGGTDDEADGDEDGSSPVGPGGMPLAGNVVIDTVEKLRAAIELGVVKELDPESIGLPAQFHIGDQLRFAFNWEGSATSGTLFTLPELIALGDFQITGGAIDLTILTDGLTEVGDTYFVFFGNNGEAYSVKLEALPPVEAEDEAVVEDDEVEEAAPIAAPVGAADAVAQPVSGNNNTLAYVALGGGLFVILAAAACIVLLQKRGKVIFGK